MGVFAKIGGRQKGTCFESLYEKYKKKQALGESESQIQKSVVKIYLFALETRTNEKKG